MLRKSPTNPRRHRDVKKFEELCASIAKDGIIQPILVRPLGDLWEVVVGEGRYLAAEKANLDTVPATIRQLTDIEALALQVIENKHREDLHELDEGEGYKRLMDAGYDVPAIAEMVQMSESWVYQRMKLSDLIEPAKDVFLAGTFSAGHAILIARLQPKQQEEALAYCFRDEKWLYNFNGKSGIQKVACSVRELESWIHENVHLDLHSAPWKKDDANLYPAAGACTTCSKRTGYVPALFPDIAKKDTCTDPTCFKNKQQLFVTAKKLELTAQPGAGAGAERPGEVNVPVLISTSYTKPKKAGVYAQGNYTVIERKADRCEHWKKAIIAEGDMKEIGHTRDVCVAPNCPRHTRHRQSSTSSPANDEARGRREHEKEQNALEFRRRVFNAIVPKLPRVLGPREIKMLALEIYDDEHDVINEHYKFGGGKKGGYLRWTEREKRIDKLKPMQLVPFLMECLLARDLDAAVHYGDSRDDLLFAAKAYKIDVKKIERGLQNEIEAKKAEDKKAAREKKKREAVRLKNQHAAQGNGASNRDMSEAARIAHALHSGEGRDKVITHLNGSAFVEYDEPTCIHCGCTEANACPTIDGGCAWVKLEEGTNRGLCSACEEAGRSFVESTGKEAKAMAKKKGKTKLKKKSASKKKDNDKFEAPAGRVG
jgi:ParB family chromosome partitioning protein